METKQNIEIYFLQSDLTRPPLNHPRGSFPPLEFVPTRGLVSGTYKASEYTMHLFKPEVQSIATAILCLF